MTELSHFRYYGEVTLSEKTIKNVLRDFGLTKTEGELYLFLARHGPLKGTELAKRINKDKAQVYRFLKRLQTKGLVEATLETPYRFSCVPFEKVVESTIKTKRDDAKRIENMKQELFDYWKKTNRTMPRDQLEKFVVITGTKKIYQKILQMINDAKKCFCLASTVDDLLRGYQFGLFDGEFNSTVDSQIKFRFLTELSPNNVDAMNRLKEKSKSKMDFRACNPDMGIQLSPRMAIRDEEEILLFLGSDSKSLSTSQDETCLWTNGNILVRSFITVFENLWVNSKDIEEKIFEIKTGKPIPSARIIKNSYTAQKTYFALINAAKKEISILTSSKGLTETMKNISLLKERNKKGVSVRIMAPITKDNLKSAQELSKVCEVRHVPSNYFTTIIIDGTHLIQSQDYEQQKTAEMPYFYTDNLEYVTKTKIVINEAWRNASVLSPFTFEHVLKSDVPDFTPINGLNINSSTKNLKTISNFDEKTDSITEQQVLNKIIKGKKYPSNWPNDPLRFYGSTANAIIHPPKSFNLPDLLIRMNHFNKQSSFGAADILHINLGLETPKGYTFVPVARVSDDTLHETKGPEFGNEIYAGTPAGKNVQLVKPEQLQMRIHGNAFFAGWTKPILLISSKYILPPACIILEGYGKLRTVVKNYDMPSGVKMSVETNVLPAFVTFFHPDSKYTGPSTDGILCRDAIFTIYPP